MIKNHIKIVLFIILLFTTVSYGDTVTAKIDTSQLDKGTVGVSYHVPSNTKIKVIISKGSNQYTYDLKSKGQFPLQMGNGEYSVSVLENLRGNQYKVIDTKKINLQVADENIGFLQSTEMVKWDNHMKATQKAKELTINAKTDQEKATLIYDYISKNIQYDYYKASTIEAGYIPSIDTILDISAGVCYDYSALYAAMLRSVGVPTKMQMGYHKDIEQYHAWNEVYLSETNEWVTIDTTYDALNVQSNITVPIIKNRNEYEVTRTY